jgi:transposase-like protein
MPIDPKGTQPGLTEPAVEKIPEVNLRCRNEKCNSIRARDVTPPSVTNAKRYQCVVCGYTWGVQTGGAFMVF